MSNETMFRWLAAALIAVAIGISSVHRRQAAKAGDPISIRPEGPLVIALMRGGGILMWLAILLSVFAPGWMAWSTWATPAWLRWTGAGIAGTAVPLFYWVFRTLGSNVTSTIATRRAHTLVTAGPYRWVRHPLYTTGFVFVLGLALALASWLIPLLAVPPLVGLGLRTPLEEAGLEARFGDAYRAYVSRTGRFLPRLTRA